MWFSHYYIRHSRTCWLFLIWIIFFILSILVLLISNSWWIIFIGWEGLGLTSFWLVAYYTSWVAHNGAMLTFITNRLGDCCLLVCSLYWLQINNFRDLSLFNFVLWGIILIGLWTKRAQFPFIRWLPAAIRAPTPVSALVHSSTLVTAGLYLLVKFNWGSFVLRGVGWWVGITTLVVGSWAALLDFDLKKVVAFSTLSQLGLIFFLFVRKNLNVVIFHLVVHAFFKSSLFICVGFIIGVSYSMQSAHIYSTQTIRGYTHYTWFYLTLINLASLPFMRGFFSKERGIFSAVTKISLAYFIIIIFILSITFSYAWRLMKSTISTVKLVTGRVLFWAGLFFRSMFNVIFLLGLGYFWAINFWLIVYDQLFTQLLLISLWLFSFFIIWILLVSVFYSVTFFLKKKLSFIMLDSISQRWNILYIPIFRLLNFNWKVIISLLLISCIVLW